MSSPKKSGQDFELLSALIAADAVASQLENQQNLGDLLANYLPMTFNDHLIYGFSYYLKEECHESKFGSGTCSFVQSILDKCEGYIRSDFTYVLL